MVPNIFQLLVRIETRVFFFLIINFYLIIIFIEQRTIFKVLIFCVILLKPGLQYFLEMYIIILSSLNFQKYFRWIFTLFRGIHQIIFILDDGRRDSIHLSPLLQSRRRWSRLAFKCLRIKAAI